VCDLTDLTGPSGPWIIENMVLKKNQIHGEQKHRKTYKNKKTLGYQRPKPKS
jgi:hypothetical protein